MSGGSFNYLFERVYEGDLHRPTVEEMAEYLRKKGYIRAAEATERVVWHLKMAESCARALGGEYGSVWHAAEWRRSGDFGDDQLAEAIEKWEAARGEE